MLVREQPRLAFATYDIREGWKKMPIPALIRVIPVILLLASVVALTGCGGSQSAAISQPKNDVAATPQPAQSEEVHVRIIDFAFEPATITIKPGTTVVWTNEGPTEHNTVSKKGKVWESNIMEKGDVYSYRFEKSGEFPYWCTLHPSMLGTVVVE